MSFSTELASLEQWWHDLIAHLFKHPAAATVAPATIAAAATASPTVSAPVIDWSQYATVQDAILRLQGKGLGVDQITAGWTAAHPGSDPTKVPEPTVAVDGAQNSTSPLASFTKAYDRGRWTFTAGNLSASVPVVAPSAGTFHFSHSGRGGAPGGDISATLTLSVEGGSGAAFTATAPGQSFTLHMSADKPTVEDVSLQPGAA